MPVHDGDALLGYLELGKEIEDVLGLLTGDGMNVEVAVAIHKNVLDR
ncbi:MAG: hypothetical protein GY826_22210, partial [Fuerstiella sp.]|nr:hypothetical protein [Fuerstiella sp.]